MRKAPTPEQKAAAKARRERIRVMMQNAAKMTDAERAALVPAGIVTNEGRHLSPLNSVLVMMQLGAAATIVGGFRQWKNAGRSVRKGEHGAGIYVPIAAGRAEPTAADLEADSAGGRPRFTIGTVFDITQTEPMTEAA